VRRAGRLLPLAAWAAGLAAVAAALAASGHGALSPPPLGSPGRWPAWFEQREPAAAAFALLRLAAVGGCWYLAVTTVVGAAVRLARADVLVGLADRVTIAPVRRFLAGSLTVALAGIAPTGMLAAGAQPAPPPTSVSAASASTTLPTSALPTSVSSSTSLPSAGATAATVTMRRLPTPGAETEPPPATPAATRSADRWTVQPGECFWTIADDVLERAWGRPPTDAEIVPYWQRLIAANRAGLADPKNADLIFPGQVLTVPPVPPAGGSGR